MGSEQPDVKIELGMVNQPGASVTSPPEPPPTSSTVQPDDEANPRSTRVCKNLCYLFIALSLPLSYASVTLATLVILPLLLLLFLVARFNQFISKNEAYARATTFKVMVCSWIYVDMVLLLVELGIFAPFAKYLPSLKTVAILGLSLANWINVICMIIGFYIFNLFFLALEAVVWLIVLPNPSPAPWDVESVHTFIDASFEATGCLLFWWAEYEVIKRVPAFEHLQLLGLHLWKWIKISLLLLMGYNIIRLTTNLIVWFMPKLCREIHISPKYRNILNKVASCTSAEAVSKLIVEGGYVGYIANGIKRSINFILTSVLLLLTWVCYVGSHLEKSTSGAKSFYEFGYWTFLSVLICSFLWLIKTGILLHWEAHAVYSRLNNKIIGLGRQLYFLVLLSHHNYTWNRKYDDDAIAVWYLVREENAAVQSNYLREVARELLLIQKKDGGKKKASMYELQQAAHIFLTSKYALSEDISIYTHLDHLRPDKDGSTEERSTEEKLSKIIGLEKKSDIDDWEKFGELLNVVDPSPYVSFDTIKTWMERAHNSCLCLLNTLSSAKDEVNCLDKVVSLVVIGATFIMWLLLTGLATTKLLVIIASPLLAITFIFGETCKTLFQGLIFVYIVHPFDVGDLCVIDDKMMEVKRIGVWSTAFTKVRAASMQEEVIYPNVALANKNIVNHVQD